MSRLFLALFLVFSANAVWGAKLRIRGMTSMTESEAKDLIGKRLEYLEARDASPSRADDAAFLLDRLLVQQGFTSPQVDWSLPGNNVILLTVKEGRRSTLGEVKIQGLDGNLLKETTAQIKSAHQARALEMQDATPYLKAHNDEAITDALHLLQSKGYWDATVSLEKTKQESGTTAMDVEVKAVPGPLYHLLPIILECEDIDPELASAMKEFEGKVATASNIRSARAQVEQFYRRRGHQFAETKLHATPENGQMQLRFVLNPGPQYRIGDVRVMGWKKVKQGLIKDRFRPFQGSHYDSDAVNEEIKELLGTGAFTGINIEEHPNDDGTIDLTLRITEAKPEGYYFYGGAGSYEGLIIGGGYYHRNLFGNLWNLTTRAEWSGLGLLGEASVTNPRFMGYDLSFTPSAFITTRTYDGYNKAEGGIGLEFEWEPAPNYTMRASFRNSAVTLDGDGLPRSELGVDSYLLHVLGFSQTYDLRDNPVLPKDGFFAKLDTDIGFAMGSRGIGFVRGEGQLSYYKTLFEDGAIALGGRAGVIIPDASDSDLPVDLRYFLGGSSSVRSFPERELGPTAVNAYPRGGEAYWSASAEYIHKIFGPVNGVLFFDAGSLNRDHNQFLQGDIKYAVGLGIRLDLPIGPVRLEYGHALNPDGRDPTGAFHFAIGAGF